MSNKMPNVLFKAEQAKMSHCDLNSSSIHQRNWLQGFNITEWSPKLMESLFTDYTEQEFILYLI